jgi:hypothetical protein
MHWSRLVDAPIAGMILLLRPLLGEARAELAVQFAWPALLMAVAILLLLRSARLFAGEAARFPALVLGATALHFLHIFAPGSLDHHNIQLVLVLATVWLLLAGGFGASIAAGVTAAASMAIGMETMPYVVAAGGVVALLFLLRGADEADTAAGFGIGLAAGAAVFTLLTVRPALWPVAACDAYSGAQAGSAILAGLGLAVLVHIFGQAGLVRRLGALVGLGVVSAAVVLVFYPQCLADPYARLDGPLKELWLSHVSEAQSLASLLVDDPADAALYYATPLVGLVLLAVAIRREGPTRTLLLVAPMLLAAFAVSAWQVRGATFSTALAILPLAAWVGRVRTAHTAAPSNAGSLRLVGGWLASFNIVWALGVAQAAGLVQGDAPPEPQASECEAAGDYAALARLPTGTVLAVSNLGASILTFTDHRTLSGPYHRNVAGNLAALNAMTQPPEAALRLIERWGVDYVAVCPGNAETQMLAERAPQGLLARLDAGEVPAWLQVAGSPDDALRLYRTAIPLR